MELISMTDFVIRLNQNKNYTDENGNKPFFETAINHYQNSNRSEDYRCIVRYANFLKQPLKLEMFVPCVNREPFNYSKHGNSEQFEQAKEKVLFEGCSTMQQGENTIVIFNDSAIWLTWTNRIVEDLLKDRVILTKNALKQFM